MEPAKANKPEKLFTILRRRHYAAGTGGGIKPMNDVRPELRPDTEIPERSGYLCGASACST